MAAINAWFGFNAFFAFFRPNKLIDFHFVSITILYDARQAERASEYPFRYIVLFG